MILYHISPGRNFIPIVTQGLLISKYRPRRDGQKQPGIYLTRLPYIRSVGLHVGRLHRSKTLDIYQVDTLRARAFLSFYVTYDDIPPAKIVHLGTIRAAELAALSTSQLALILTMGTT